MKLGTLDNWTAFCLKADMEPTGDLLPGVIPRAGTALFVGAPGSGKTSFLARVALSCSNNVPFLGREVTPGPVVFLSYEHTRSLLKTHFVKAAKALRIEPNTANLYFLDPSKDGDLTRPEQARELAAELDRIGCVMVVVDSLRAISDHDENDSGEVRGVLKVALDILTSGGKRVAIGIHHPNRRGDARGTHDFRAGTDTIILFDRPDDTSPDLAITAKPHGGGAKTWRLRMLVDDDALSYEEPHEDGQVTKDSKGKRRKRTVAEASCELLARGRMSQRQLLKALRTSGVPVRNGDLMPHLQSAVLRGSIRIFPDGELGLAANEERAHDAA